MSSIESIATPPPGVRTSGPLAVGDLVLERLDGGGMRLNRSGMATVPFTVTDDPAETPYALAVLPTGVLIFFGLHGERLGVTLLQDEDLDDLLLLPV